MTMGIAHIFHRFVGWDMGHSVYLSFGISACIFSLAFLFLLKRT